MRARFRVTFCQEGAGEAPKGDLQVVHRAPGTDGLSPVGGNLECSHLPASRSSSRGLGTSHCCLVILLYK